MKFAMLVGVLCLGLALPAAADEINRWRTEEKNDGWGTVQFETMADGVLVYIDGQFTEFERPRMTVTCSKPVGITVRFSRLEFTSANVILINQDETRYALGTLYEDDGGWAAKIEVTAADLLNGARIFIVVRGAAPFDQTISWDLRPAPFAIFENRDACLSHGI